MALLTVDSLLDDRLSKPARIDAEQHAEAHTLLAGKANVQAASLQVELSQAVKSKAEIDAVAPPQVLVIDAQDELAAQTRATAASSCESLKEVAEIACARTAHLAQQLQGLQHLESKELAELVQSAEKAKHHLDEILEQLQRLKASEQRKTSRRQEIRFRAVCSETVVGDELKVVGSCRELGGWDTGRGLVLQTSADAFPLWTGLVTMDAPVEVEFKLVIARPSRDEWEDLQNRSLRIPADSDGPWEVSLQYNHSSMVGPKHLAQNAWPRLLGRAPGDCDEKDALDHHVRAVGQDELDALMTRVVGHIHGLSAPLETPGQLRECACFGTIPSNLLPTILCEKGNKQKMDTSPNQDNFSVTHFQTGHTLICACDGHGKHGHIAAARAAQTMPFFIATETGISHGAINEAGMEEAMLHAFQKAENDLVAHSAQHVWDVGTSGTTAVVALVKGHNIWTANLGDSRAAIGSVLDRKLTFATKDHTPQCAKERARVEAMGGQVVSEIHPDGRATHRIFSKGATYGLSVARTLGDQSLKSHGVCAVPEVAHTMVDPSRKPFVLLASDGLWEFLDSKSVVKAAADQIAQAGPATAVQLLHKEAKKKWRQVHGGKYSDDITSVLLQL
ncbi:unnamed protein product [Effrenium voratum]|uniref:Uncharacterized protein n=1 Tax=Effrenium voratum TaxID=2562239 RepID=A0AA36IYQ8_9DINO|nr:unnamed protein product [Effrenium voratum]